jgi:hypothetical protein
LLGENLTLVTQAKLVPFLRSFLTIILPDLDDLDFFRSLQVFKKRVYYIWSKSFKIEKSSGQGQSHVKRINKHRLTIERET